MMGVRRMTSQVTELRMALRRAGFDPLPLDGKRPAMNGWQTKFDSSDEEIRLWSKVYPHHPNTGLLTRRTPALDADILNPEAAEATEEMIREKFEDGGPILTRIGLPPKRAFLFQTDEPFAKIVVNLIAPGGGEEKIEFLGDGQQVVVAGIHPTTGQPYRWHGGEPGPVLREDLPYIGEVAARQLVEDIVEMLVRDHWYQRKVAPKANGKGDDHGKTGERERFDWGRFGDLLDHDNLTSVAMALIKGGLDKTAVFNLLRSRVEAIETSDTARKQRRLAELRGIVDSAAGKAGTAGSKNGKAPQRPREMAQKAEELRTMKFQPIKRVVADIIVEGLTLLAGKPKIGKSWLLLHAAIAVARGGYTLGDVKCTEGDVLYCALEDNKRRMRSRMSKLIDDREPWPDRLHFQYEMPRLADGGLDYIREWIEKADDPRLVIVDTLAMVRAPKGKDQTQYDADYAAVLAMRELASTHGVAIVVVHHLRKMESDDAFDTVSGTLGLTGAPDTILVLKRENSGATVLYGRGRDVADFEKAVMFNKNTCTWAITGDADEARTTEARRRIIAAMNEIGEPAGPNDIAAHARTSATNAKTLLRKLLKEGMIRKVDHGKYAPT
jgi:hypothetical protein